MFLRFFFAKRLISPKTRDLLLVRTIFCFFSRLNGIFLWNDFWLEHDDSYFFENQLYLNLRAKHAVALSVESTVQVRSWQLPSLRENLWFWRILHAQVFSHCWQFLAIIDRFSHSTAQSHSIFCTKQAATTRNTTYFWVIACYLSAGLLNAFKTNQLWVESHERWSMFNFC